VGETEILEGRHPHRIARALTERWRDVEVEFHRAYWRSQVEATPESEKRRAELELELSRLKGDADALHAVNVALEGEIHDPVLRRQLEVLRLSLTANQMSEAQRELLVELSSAVESDFATFRPQLDGRRVSDNEIEEILKRSADEDLRREAWLGSKEIGSRVAERVREMARTRNEVARQLGWPDYFRMSLELQELPEAWLFGLLGELEELTSGPFRRWKADLDARLARRFGSEVIRPWHYADAFFQQLPPDGAVSLDAVLSDADAADLARRTFELWGIDMGRVMEGSDLYPRADKCQHAFCLDVDRAGDVRILANIVPGERWIEVMLHESGHAAYDVSIEARLPYLLRRPAHTFVTEAIAILSGRLVRDEMWLREVAGVPEERTADLLPALELAGAAQKTLFARWGLVMVHFERDLYSDPEADLDGRWWELVERFQMVAPPPERTAPDWAAKIHTAVAPVYYQNYLLGELLASQLRQTCEREAGGLVGNREAGDLLAERIFARGNSGRWDAIVEDATGAPLSAEAFARSVAVLG
jgi:peptidyl-dipeptidase A